MSATFLTTVPIKAIFSFCFIRFGKILSSCNYLLSAALYAMIYQMEMLLFFSVLKFPDRKPVLIFLICNALCKT